MTARRPSSMWHRATMAGMATSTPTVLVVEDERPLEHLVRSYLEREQFRVVEAFDGRQALDAARAEGPDVIVTVRGVGYRMGAGR